MTQQTNGRGGISVGPTTALMVLVAAMLAGCVGDGRGISDRQESLGEGIVLGAMAVRGDLEGTSDYARRPRVTGQVVALEGAAYVVRAETGQEVRIPHDENTSSDRPAHVGDHIEAALDGGGRAIYIRNVNWFSSTSN